MNEDVDYYFKAGFDEMDFDIVTGFLTKAYWSLGIGKDEVIRAAQNSALVVGAFTGDGRQIGYLRVISDKTKFAYVLDVIVDEDRRKQGIGQAMLKYMLAHPDLKSVGKWALLTSTAHGVYRKLGFAPVDRPNDWMELKIK